MGRLLGVVIVALGLMAAPALAQSAKSDAPKAEAKPAAKSAAKIDLSGSWQGTLTFVQPLRSILKISKAPGGGYKADFYSIDQGRNALPVDAITLSGSTMKYAIARINGSYEGQLQPDGNSIKGMWTQNGRSTPLDVVRASKETAWAIDPSSHKIQFITTSDHVKLEVLDWGGVGKPLVFIPGLGADAHVFDKFAPQFTAKYHVYGVTRRGFGDSDHPDPAAGAVYTAERLGDDVLAAIDALKLDKPVLAGWSFGGEEMSSIATRHAQKVAGLIYLDAAYAYGFYAPGNLVPLGENVTIDLNDIRTQMTRARQVTAPEGAALLDKLQKVDLPQLQADLAATENALADIPAGTPAPSQPPDTIDRRIADAILAGEAKFTELKIPVLAIFASPPEPPNATEAVRAALAKQRANGGAQIERFQAGNPSAKVVVIANAQHAVFTSNPDQVAREMNAFLDGLK